MTDYDDDDDDDSDEPFPFLIVNLDNRLFAIPSMAVQEIVSIPRWVALPECSKNLRGVVNLRGHIYPLVDLRTTLGMSSLRDKIEEMITMLNLREQDHKDWLAALEESVEKGTPFTKARDPHLCAFGKWYYAFKTEDRSLETALARFEKPHAEIHALADKALNELAAGRREQAKQLIASARHSTLAHLLELFEELRTTFRESSRELAVILKINGRELGASIDAVRTVETLDEATIKPLTVERMGIATEFVKNVAQTKAGDLVFMLEIEPLVANAV